MGKRADFTIGVGLSWTALAGRSNYFRNLNDRTILGPTLAARVGIATTPRSRLEIGLANAIYSIRYGEGSAAQESFLQNDVILSAAWGLAPGR